MKSFHITFACLASLFVLTLVHAGTTDDDRAPAVKSETFDSAGVKIAYVEAGEGEPVILVHGLYSSAEMNWQLPGTFRMLAAHYHVVALDLRGPGKSDKPTEEDAYGQPMVDDIVRLMDHLKIERAHIVGYSLGGIIAMKFIVDHPDRVISGTLGGMGWLRTGSKLQEFWERTPGREGNGTPPACVHGIGKLAVSEEQVKSVKAPMEILVGDHDRCKQMYVEPLQKVRKDWRVIEIEGAGHLMCVAKEQFKEELVKWMDKNANRS
jgi:dipeptidyl aminopeptidase/acylaminoacyl peptidase